MFHSIDNRKKDIGEDFGHQESIGCGLGKGWIEKLEKYNKKTFK